MSAVVFLSLFFLSSVLAALPSGWKACKQSSPDFSPCLGKAMETAIKSLANGDKKMGVPPLDPLVIKKLVIPKTPGPVSLGLTFEDLTLIGMKDSQVQSFMNDWKTAEVVLLIPRFDTPSKYKGEGKMLVLNVQGEGPCNITFYDLKMVIKMQFKRESIKGKEHILVKDFNLVLHPKKAYFYFDNLFNGDKQLGEATNRFGNENWQEIFEYVKPPLQVGLSKVFKAIANTVLSAIPASELELS